MLKIKKPKRDMSCRRRIGLVLRHFLYHIISIVW